LSGDQIDFGNSNTLFRSNIAANYNGLEQSGLHWIYGEKEEYGQINSIAAIDYRLSYNKNSGGTRK
jgi:hypothetical protein